MTIFCIRKIIGIGQLLCKPLHHTPFRRRHHHCRHFTKLLLYVQQHSVAVLQEVRIKLSIPSRHIVRNNFITLRIRSAFSFAFGVKMYPFYWFRPLAAMRCYGNLVNLRTTNKTVCFA